MISAYILITMHPGKSDKAIKEINRVMMAPTKKRDKEKAQGSYLNAD